MTHSSVFLLKGVDLMDFTISLDILVDVMKLIVPSVFLWAFTIKGLTLIVRAATGKRYLDE